MKSQCDIVLLSYENPLLLKKCIESILKNTKMRSTLIIVDNGSKDPAVKEYLNEVHGNKIVDVEKVFCEENSGFAAGMNKGIRLSDASFICLMNNDCIVTEGWLEEMISVALKDKKIGLVNPQSNTFGSLADRGTTIDEHSKLLSDKKGKFVELGHAIGFACLIKRDVIDKIGYLDEIYQGVCYEDTDFSIRARKAGFLPVLAEGSYVFHKEQASRRSLKGKKEIYARNRKIFENRWGKTLRLLYMDNVSSNFDDNLFRADYMVLKGLAREGAIIDMWAVRDRKVSDIDMEGFYNAMVRHADIGIKVLDNRLTGLLLLWKVLTKKKKYDAVLLKKGFLSGVLKVLHPLHGGVIMNIDKEKRISSARGAQFDLKEPAVMADFLREKYEKDT